MKITCTPKEFAHLIRCCDSALEFGEGTCGGCVLKDFCPGVEHIEGSNAIEVVPGGSEVV